MKGILLLTTFTLSLTAAPTLQEAKHKVVSIAKVGYSSAKPYVKSGATMAQDFYTHPTATIKNVGERICSFDTKHPGLIVKIAGGVLGAYIVYKATKWLYGKLSAKSVEVKRASACAAREAKQQNPKLKAFQETLKK